MAMTAGEVFRHRIVATGVEWMATADSSRTKPAAAQDTEALDCLHSVGRAARIKTATLSQ